MRWSKDRLQKALDLFAEKGRPAPATTTNFEDILRDEQIDAVVIMTSWNTHVSLAKASVLAGKYTAVEVGCAYSLQECYDLIDAYDTVSWMAIAPLSEMSIQKGGMPVDIPDFTRGKWIRREPVVQSKYCLDEVITDPDTPIFP